MCMLYADVIVNIVHEQLDRSFSYKVPERLLRKLRLGSCVMIPFGKGDRLIKGYCVGLSEECKYDPSKLKEIADVVEADAGDEGRSVALAAWIKENYGSTMIQALKTVLPMRKSVKKLEHRTILRTATKEELISMLGECQRKHQVAKARLLESLLSQERIPYEWVTGKLGVSAQAIHSLEQAGALKVLSDESFRDPVKLERTEEEKKKLSPDQESIVQTVLADYDAEKRGTYLIHGITGSGKTEVYLRLVEGVVARGRQVIVLIPEIALTYQTLLRFYGRFGNRVSVMNSTLSAGEKYDQCQRAKAGEIDVIIGPRSALFTPFPNLGLIIMDEEHEASYKSEGTPKYHARETAEKLAELAGASLVLGSATPSIEAYYRASQGQYGLFRLKERLTGGTLPEVEIVDLRAELQAGNRSIFSRKLQDLLADRLAKKQQSMLFL
ncbi:MAG: primosomal protein N', partial [Lachnospiraceae bacterium]|nr:primosomal protein N' [Lachnospiraceae bacterium]